MAQYSVPDTATKKSTSFASINMRLFDVSAEDM
jgi:hypothetical protein